eukprot:TRINITY_DN12119_c0_g1_i1.p1 TRINITY_DN12119_c0_g1~~TRINITY_DN12119_c0_g1_i1.p1  ORF type:complete len:1280 (+),score=252.81 TRINITY_DN12119_c0_g1_i1:35-3841(+)
MVRNAKDLLQTFSLRVTGGVCGDMLVGCAKGTRGGLIQLVGDKNTIVKPIKCCLDMMKEDKTIWDEFLVKLAKVERYAGLDTKAREKKVWKEAKDVSTNLPVSQGVEGMRIRVLSLPQTIVERVDEANMQRILEKEDGWRVQDLLAIDGLSVPGSTKPSLVFLTGWWKVTTDTTMVPVDKNLDFSGTCIDITSGAQYADTLLIPDTVTHMYVLTNFASKYRKTTKGYVRDGDGTDIGFLVPPMNAKRPGFEVVGNEKTALDEAFNHFGTGIFKSALQKMIRFTPKNVCLPSGASIPGDVVVRYLFCRLRDSNGQFVPDIQRWVGGVESLAKRGAVSGFEDSNPSLDASGVASLFSGALLAQRVPSWKPCQETQEKWLATLLKLYNSPTAATYSIKAGLALKPYTLPDSENPIQASSAILDELRSFQGDLALTRNTAHLYTTKKALATTTYKARPATMPLPEHAIDQHVNPNIVYLFPYPIEFGLGAPGAPFKPLLSEFFVEVTGVNPRKTNANGFEARGFVKKCRSVQTTFRKILQATPTPRKSIKTMTVQEEVDSSWIAGMVGVVNVGKVNGVAMVVTLSVEDPLKLVAVRAPARGATDNMLHDAERQEEAKLRCKNMLKKGVAMNNIRPAPHSSLASCEAVLHCDEDNNPESFSVRAKGGKLTPWDEAKSLKLTIPVHKPLPVNLDTAVNYSGDGVEEDFEEKLKEILDKTDKKVTRRSLMYISENKTRFRMSNVSRDGGGTEGAVVKEDIGVYQLLMNISVVCPVAVAPVRHHPFSFAVKSLPMLWRVRRLITEHLSTTETSEASAWPSDIDDRLNRVVMPHQKEALQDMINAHHRKLHGNFLYIPPGMGKTLIVMLYIRWLAQNNRLPPYVVYTLPKSAMKSVLHEIVALGMPVTVVRPVKSKQVVKLAKELFEGVDPDLVKVDDKAEMTKYRIIMAEHDDLRLCEERLTGLASEGFLFINDEVHKTLATTTKRTSVALELATLSREFIALTGTPIISSSAYPLIGWLQRIAPFTVTGTNFWVAANSMIAHTVSTGVCVERHDSTPVFSNIALKKYLKHVPSALICQEHPGANANPRPEDWRVAAEMCYDLCDVKMIEQTVKDISKGVMLVVRDKAHQARIVKALLGKKIAKEDIFALGGDPKGSVDSAPSIFLTSQAVRAKSVKPYRIAVIPVRMAEGYSLTHLTTFITSVYPCNNSTREQLEGRINRISQEAKEVTYYTYHCGVLSYIHKNHLKAHDLSAALKSMAKVVETSSIAAVTEGLQ